MVWNYEASKDHIDSMICEYTLWHL